jgi:hypothetical protein
VDAILAGEGFFAEPSAAVQIDPPYDFDLDTAADVLIAEALIAAGVMNLAHVSSGPDATGPRHSLPDSSHLNRLETQ